MKCQRPARTVQETVRRTLNRNGGGWAWDVWSCIAYRESRWVAGVTGRAGERGVFQIHPINFHLFAQPDRLWEPEYNTLAALTLYRLSGWGPWRGADASCGI